MRRNPLRYVPWLAVDLLMGPAALFVIVAGLLAAGAWKAGVTPAGAGRLLGSVIQQASLPFVLIATAQMVSGDFRRGYFRSYFNRPVSPLSHYMLRWLLGGIAVVLFVPLAYGAIALTSGPFTLDPALLGGMAMLYLLLGGLVFLASTVSRYDWALAFLVLVVESVLHKLDQTGSLSGGWSVLATILPPFHLAQPGGPQPAGGALWHVLGYGGGVVLGALLILRFRPLGAGGRE